MPIDSVATLVRLVEQYGLIDPQNRPEFTRVAATASRDVRSFARDLLQRGWLTAYQINQLFQDNAASLVLGSYIVLERLGSGGMGQVFKARHQKLGRIVALKIILKERLNNPRVVKRFEREIRAASALSHPNVVHATDAEEVDHNRILIMEYVEGVDLGRLVRERGPLPADEASEYIRQAALGLQHAFEKGMVHRDIKPSNLLLSTKEQTVKILDMGLALVEDASNLGSQSGGLTVLGAVVGSVDFLAPEQARDASSVDIRADLYSLGCTYYYLLTGQVPFSGATVMNKLFKHAAEQAEPVEKLRPDIPPAVAAIVRRLMAKKPEDRYQTPAELAAVLDDLTKRRSARVGSAPGGSSDSFANQTAAAKKENPPVAQRVAVMPIPSDPTGTGRPAAAVVVKVKAVPVATPTATIPTRARPATTPPSKQKGTLRIVLWSATGLILLAVMLGTLVILWPRLLKRTTDGSGETTVSQADRELDALAKQADNPEANPALRQQVQQFRLEHLRLPQAVSAGALLHRLPSPLDTLDPKNIANRDGLPGEVVARFSRPTTEPTQILFAPNGQHLLVIAKNSPPQLWDVPAGKEIPRFESLKDAHTADLSFDGQHAAFGVGNVAHLWDAAAGKEMAEQTVPAGMTVLAISADGKQMVSGGRDNSVLLWIIGEKPSTLGKHDKTVVGIAILPDDRTAVTASADRTVRVWNLFVPKVRSLGEAPKPNTCLALAADGKHVFTGNTDGVRRWDLDGTGTPGGTALEGYSGSVTAIAASIDGRLLAAAGDKGWVGIWDLGTGQKTREFQFAGTLSSLSFADDSKHLAVAAGADGVYILRLQ